MALDRYIDIDIDDVDAPAPAEMRDIHASYFGRDELAKLRERVGGDVRRRLALSTVWKLMTSYIIVYYLYIYN
jgi:hypothetical protein